MDKNSYLGTDFVLTFPTVNDITSEIKAVQISLEVETCTGKM